MGIAGFGYLVIKSLFSVKRGFMEEVLSAQKCFLYSTLVIRPKEIFLQTETWEL